MDSKRRVAVFTGNSNSGSACIEELFERYADKVIVRGVFRSHEKAAPYRLKYPQLEVCANADASDWNSMNGVFDNCQVAVVVTPHDMSKGFSEDAKLTENMVKKAVESGVNYIVYVGSFTCNFPDTIQIISSRFIPTENLLKQLGKYRWEALFIEFLFR